MRKILLMPILVVIVAVAALVAWGGDSSPRVQRVASASLAGWGKSAYLPTTTTSTSTTSTTQPSPPPPQRTTRKATKSAAPVGGDLWARVRACENRGSYGKGTSPSYFGAYQFSPDTWATASSHAQGGSYGSATPAQQEAAKDWLYTHADPYRQWPVCYPRALRGG